MLELDDPSSIGLHIRDVPFTSVGPMQNFLPLSGEMVFPRTVPGSLILPPGIARPTPSMRPMPTACLSALGDHCLTASRTLTREIGLRLDTLFLDQRVLHVPTPPPSRPFSVPHDTAPGGSLDELLRNLPTPLAARGLTLHSTTRRPEAIPMPTNYLTLTRQSLYDMVWSRPITQVALDFGISDVALAKRCKSVDVPVPPRGYWARVAAGQTPPKTPLPKYRTRTPEALTAETASRRQPRGETLRDGEEPILPFGLPAERPAPRKPSPAEVGLPDIPVTGHLILPR